MEKNLNQPADNPNLIQQTINRRLKRNGISKRLVNRMIKYHSWDKINDIKRRHIIFESPDIIIPYSYFSYSLKSGDISSYLVVRYVEVHQDNLSNSDLAKFQRLVISSHNASSIYRFGKNVMRANLTKIVEEIIKLEDSYYIYVLLANHQFEPTLRAKLISSLADIGNPEFIFKALPLFTEDKKAFKELVDALICSEDALYLKKFELQYPKLRITKRVHTALVDTLNRAIKNKDMNTISDCLFELEDEYNVDIFLKAKAKIEHPRKNKDIVID